MKKIVCSVYDCKSAVYGSPMVFSTRGEAIRSFDSGVKDSKTMLYKYPADFTMHVLGEFDDNCGKLLPFDQPEFLAKAQDFVNIDD